MAKGPEVLHSSQVDRYSPSNRWAYFGKGVDPYRWTQTRFGSESEFRYEEKLRQAAEELRQPFLDFVAEIGSRQKDPVTWWSSRFSWKLWTASDLFLLLCYLSVARSLIEENLHEEKFLVIIEDPWLLRQLRETLGSSHPQIRVATVNLWKERFVCLAGGTARRVRWLWRVLRDSARQKRCWPRGNPPAPETPAVGIFSYPSKNSFETAGIWRDSHLPGLDRMIVDLGWQAARFTPPECGGWEKELAQRSSYTYPLILWSTVGRVFRSLTAFWWPQWPERLQVQGQSIRWLCLREWWLETGRSSLCAYRLFYECLRGMLSSGNWKSLVTFYENQPWEKLQVLAARASGVKTIGFQMTTFSRYHLSYALGKGEEERMPLPDRIGSSGVSAHRLLLECGAPASSLKQCGALRYSNLLDRSQQSPPIPNAETGPVQILVVLSIDPVLSRHLLEALSNSFPDGGVREGLRFKIRPHPMCPIPSRWVRFPAALTPSDFSDFRESMNGSALILFTASMVGFEAAAEGKPVLRYRSPRLFDVDDLYGPNLPVATDSNLREELLRQVRSGFSSAPPEEERRWISDFFAPVNRAGMEELLRW